MSKINFKALCNKSVTACGKGVQYFYLNFQKITFQVLDTKEVVRRCMLHEERAYRIQIDRLLRQRNLINAALEKQTCEKMSSLNL